MTQKKANKIENKQADLWSQSFRMCLQEPV